MDREERYLAAVVSSISSSFTKEELTTILEDLGIRVKSSETKKNLALTLINTLKDNYAEQEIYALLDKVPKTQLVEALSSLNIKPRASRKEELIKEILENSRIKIPEQKTLREGIIDYKNYVMHTLQSFIIHVGKPFSRKHKGIPKITISDEAEVRNQIAAFIKGRLSVEYPELTKLVETEKTILIQTGRRKKEKKRIDIAISDKVGIEIKVLDKLTEFDRLWGQVAKYGEHFEHIVVVLVIPESKAQLRQSETLRDWVKKLRARKIPVLIVYAKMKDPCKQCRQKAKRRKKRKSRH